MDLTSSPQGKKLWYFAYGSNMSTAKFIGSRGIQPLDAARVSLPGWRLTMEIPGVPYSEPAFSSVRAANGSIELGLPEVIGVAYLITDSQYKKVIASEGGGIAYDDISIDAKPVASEDAVRLGPHPRVRTLGTAMSRQPPARPSKRYMDLLNVGAAEARLPEDYQRYLSDIPIYHRPDKERQRLGAMIFAAIWGPIMSLMEKLVNGTIQKDGNAPFIVVWLVRCVVSVMWSTHDNIFAPMFGRGDGLLDNELGMEESQSSLLEKTSIVALAGVSGA